MSSNTNGNGTKEKAKECRLTEVFIQMRKDDCEFFMNSQLRPTVEIPDDGFQQEWPADGQRIQDLVISLYYEMTGDRITSSERDFLMALLREE